MKWENKDEIINMLEEQGYYLMNPDNVEEFIKCGTDAFKGYELYDYFFGDGDYEEKLSLFIKSILKSNKDTIIYADSENINGIVQWAPPGFTGGSSLQFMLAGAWKGLLKKGFYGALKRGTYVEKVSYNIKKALTSHDDIYLYNLGVKKNQQGKGIAKKLVKPMFDYLKQHGKKCYLETYSPKNVEIYNRIGMELLNTLEVPGTSLTHYAFIYNNHKEKSEKS